MKFTLLQDWIQEANMVGAATLTLGSRINVELPTDAPIESIGIRVRCTTSATMATANPDGLGNILKNVTLQTFGPEGPTPVVQCSGPGLLELQAQEGPAFDEATDTHLGTNSNAAKEIWYWIHFPDPRLADLISPAYLLPAHLHTKAPLLTLEFASQADMDVNATPTFALTASTLQVELLVNRRFVNVRDFRYLRSDIQERTYNWATSGTYNEQRIYLDPPGWAAGVLFRCYTSASARGNPSANLLSWRFLNNGVQERRARLEHLKALNDTSRLDVAAVTFAGSYYWDFVSDRACGSDVFELGSVADLNIPEQSGRKAFFVGDITGGAGVAIKTVTRRFLDLPGSKAA